MGNPYFDSASSNIDQGKAALLNAVAQAGTAGKTAFDNAQAQVAQTKQAALAGAAQRSAITGVQGVDAAPMTGAYDARSGQLAANQQGFTDQLQNMSVANQAYLEKERAAIPVLQAINENKASAAEGSIKAAIAAAQAKAQTAADAANTLQNREDARTNATISAANNRATIAAAAKTSTAAPTSNQIFQAQPLSTVNPASKLPTGDVALAAAKTAYDSQDQGTKDAEPFGDYAKAYLAYKGYDTSSINSILTPSALATYGTAANKIGAPDTTFLPPSPDAAALMKTPGVDAGVAKTILADPEYQNAVNMVSTFANTAVDSTGAITESGPYQGMTPWAAYSTWLKGNLAPNKTRTLQALTTQYRPFLMQIAGK